MATDLAELVRRFGGTVAAPAAPAAPAASATLTAPSPMPGPDLTALAAQMGGQVAAAPPPQMGFLESIEESITGRRRATEETRTLPEWTSMPELNQLSVASFKAALGSMMTSPQETVQVLRANFPNMGIRQDARGNFILRSPTDGREYAIPPGFSVGDIPRALGSLFTFTPAGRATTIPGAIAAGAGTQAAIEATQAATGGQFNPAEVAIAGAVGPVGVVAQRGTAALRQRMAAPPAAMPPSRVEPPLGAPPVAPPAPGPTVMVPTPTEAVAPALLSAEELAATARKAAEGGFMGRRAMTVLAEQAAPDPKVLEAARRLGIEDYLQPDHLTANQAYRELAQAVKSIPGSEARAAELQGLNQVGERADSLIREIGGMTDLSRMSGTVRARLDQNIGALEKQATTAYKNLATMIPPTTPGATDNVVGFIRQRAVNLGGEENLSAMEKSILKRLAPEVAEGVTPQPPTYALIDDVRKEIGAAAREKGPFKDADTGLAKKLYSLIDEDQAIVARQAGQGDAYEVAKGLVRVRKGLEDDMVALFGKQLDQSLVTKLESATGALTKGDADKLANILRAIPADMRQMVTASALNTAFGKATANGALNFNTYAKWYDGLLQNRQAYAALMTNLPQSARKQLSDLYRISDNINKATRERITTGRIQSVQQDLQGADTLLSNVYAVAKRSAIGLPIEAATTAMGLPGAGIASGVTAALTKGKPNTLKAADALLSSPEFQRLAAEAGNPSQQALRAAAQSSAFRKFADAVKIPVDPDARIAWLQNATQAQRTMQAEPTPQE